MKGSVFSLVHFGVEGFLEEVQVRESSRSLGAAMAFLVKPAGLGDSEWEAQVLAKSQPLRSQHLWGAQDTVWPAPVTIVH